MKQDDTLVVNDKQAMTALKKHGGNIVLVIVVVLAGFFGWQFYQKNYAKIDTVAADSYTVIDERNDSLVLGLQNPDLDEQAKQAVAQEQSEVFAQIDTLVKNHGTTAYAWQALMIKARHQTDNGQYQEAIETLKQAQAIKLEDDGLSALASLRLGQVLLATQQIEEALAVANQPLPKGFEPSRQELLGDIYMTNHETDKAKEAYAAAWQALQERGKGRSVLKVKMESLGMMAEPILPKHQIVMMPATQESAIVSEMPSVDDSQAPNSSTNDK